MVTRLKRDASYQLEELEYIISELAGIRSVILNAEAELSDEVAVLHRAHRGSARNLLHYIALRQRDIRNRRRVEYRNALNGADRLARF
ncbi:MAG TPA: hypothetical protein VFQ92_00205 [Blastocatellia bacterium]|nr:hypothetical protein [Blastocatellia bacterium]